MNTHKTGTVLGLFFGVLVLIWEIVLALGFGQTLLDWKLSLWSLNNPFTVMPFNLVTGVELIVMAVVGGYILGAIFAIISKKIHK